MKRFIACPHIFAVIFFIAAGAKLFAQASVTTDASDYPPGSTVLISGSGFASDETVELQVSNITDSADAGPEHDPWQVTADENGNFQTTWYVTDDEANQTLLLTATGLTSGLTAQAIFTDASYNISSISAGNQTGTLAYGTSGSATYTITNFFSGNGQAVKAVTNRIAGNLPTGVTAIFNLLPTQGPGNGGTTGTAGAFTNELTLSTSANTPAGSFIVMVAGDDDKGGHATNSISLTVGAAPLSITANNDTKIYGQTKTYGAGSTAFSSSGLKNGETIGSATITASGGTATNSPLGNYTLTPSAATGGTFDANNYSITYINGTLTVIPGPASTLVVSGYPSPRVAGNPGTVTVTAKDQFGNIATNYTGTVRLTSSDSQAALAANHTFTVSDAGTHTFSGNIFYTAGVQSLTATDINSNSVTGAQSGIIILGGTVAKLIFSTQPTGAVYKTTFTTQPVVTVQDVYGNISTNGLPATLTVSLALTTGTGPLSGTTNLNIGMTGGKGTASYSGLQINRAENGDVITASASSLTSVASSSFNVATATLTVTASNTNRVYGAPNPIFTAGYTGFLGGDNASILSGNPSFSTIANTTSNTGIYVISVTNGTLSAANYSFAFANGVLTIMQASTTNVVSVSANPSPTGSNVTLTATFSAIAPGSGTPTGTAQFIVDGSAFGAPANLSSGVASLTTASLAHGYHTVAAQYGGDVNFFGSTNNLSPNLLIDTAPVPGTFLLGATENTAANFSAIKLASVGKDADHDAISVTAVNSTSAQGGTVSLSGTTITYLPATNYIGADSINYTLADSFGVTASGVVNVTVNSINGQTLNIVSMAMQADGSAKLELVGIPGRNYLVQATTNLILPAWTTIATNAADTNGLFNFIDTNAPNYPARYYRTASP